MKLVGTRQVIVDSGFKPATNPEHIEGPRLFRRDATTTSRRPKAAPASSMRR